MPRRIVLTGGPGAGKTATLELIRRSFPGGVQILPEAAGIVFGGGFPRRAGIAGRQAAQRAIFHVQRELEAMADAEPAPLILCDRGTVDGSAYWPGPQDFWQALGTSRATEHARYDLVIHLRTPPPAHGYNTDNRLRTETPEEAAELDRRIARAWDGHPRRVFVDSHPDFLAKAASVLALVDEEFRRHPGYFAALPLAVEPDGGLPADSRRGGAGIAVAPSVDTRLP